VALEGRTAASAPFESVLSLDGANDWASASDSASLDLGTAEADDFTIETFFFVPDLANSSTDNLIWKNNAYGMYVIFSEGAPDRLIFRIWTAPGAPISIFGDEELSTGWHHVAGVFDNEFAPDADLLAIYLDGNELAVSDSAFELTPGIPDSGSALNVGAYLGIHPYVGFLEETRFANVVRYSGSSYIVPELPFSSDQNTLALWHYDETPGSTSFGDSSGNGNTLTGLNGAQTASTAPTPTPGPPTPTPVGLDSDGDTVPDEADLDDDNDSNSPPEYAQCLGLCPGGYWRDFIEQAVNTSTSDRCADTVAAGDELDDKWPPDFDDNRSVNVFDFILWRLDYASPPKPYSPRADLDATGTVNILDFGAWKAYFGAACAP
jgi:hypothetical protein